MNEKDQEIGGLSTLYTGNKPEHTGKHLQLTTDILMGSLIPNWVCGLEKDPALRKKKQSVMIKPFESHWPNGRWNRNQGALVPLVKPDEHSTAKKFGQNLIPKICLPLG